MENRISHYRSYLVASGNGPGENTFPKAFVNILLFDKDFNFLDIAYEPIDGGGGPGIFISNPWSMTDAEWIASSRPGGPSVVDRFSMQANHEMQNVRNRHLANTGGTDDQGRRWGYNENGLMCYWIENDATDVTSSDGIFTLHGYRSIFVIVQQGGPGDPPTSGQFEFNLTFTFGPQAGFSLFGGLISANVRAWTFGEISTKDGISGQDFHDGKVTSEHSFNFAFANATYGKGMEHKLEYQGGDMPFLQTDFRWLNTDRGLTTKTDVLGNVIERKYDNNLFQLNLVLFSIALSKDFK